MPMLADWLTVLVIGCLAVISPGPNLAIILRNSLVYLRRPPRQVLVGEPHEQGFKIRTDGGSAPSGAIPEGPCATDQFAVPLQQGLRFEQEDDLHPAGTRPHAPGVRQRRQFPSKDQQ